MGDNYLNDNNLAYDGLQAENQVNFSFSVLQYIFYQRTGYFTRKIKMLKNINHYLASLCATIVYRKRTKKLFVADLYSDYLGFKDYLPNKISKVLDIGCGIGGIDIFLSRHGNPEIHLFDKTEITKELEYEFSENERFYTSLPLAKKFLGENDIKNVFLHEVDDGFPKGTFDVVISLLAWGFHFPVETYIENVKDVLSPNGVLIVDIRKDTKGLEELREIFPYYKKILEERKFNRFLFKYKN